MLDMPNNFDTVTSFDACAIGSNVARLTVGCAPQQLLLKIINANFMLC